MAQLAEAAVASVSAKQHDTREQGVQCTSLSTTTGDHAKQMPTADTQMEQQHKQLAPETPDSAVRAPVSSSIAARALQKVQQTPGLERAETVAAVLANLQSWIPGPASTLGTDPLPDMVEDQTRLVQSVFSLLSELDSAWSLMVQDMQRMQVSRGGGHGSCRRLISNLS
eukprot:jgi/Chrzof1/7152/Cz02g13020.t1